MHAHSFSADLDHFREDIRNGKKWVSHRLLAVSFDQAEDRLVTVRIVLNLQPFTRQFRDKLVHRDGLVQLDQASTATRAFSFFHQRLFQWRRISKFTGRFGRFVEQIQILVVCAQRPIAQFRFIVKILGALVVTFPNLNQVAWAILRQRFAA